MSLLNTKPRYFSSAVATESGWINPITKELLVSVGNLKSKLLLETSLHKSVVAKQVPSNIFAMAEPKEEIVMIENEPEIKTRKVYTLRKPKLVGEMTESKLSDTQQIIGEVVTHDVDARIIGE